MERRVTTWRLPQQAAQLRHWLAEPTEAPGRAVPYPVCDKTVPKETEMSWLVLVVSGVLEAVWATALGRSEGFTRLGSSLIFAVSVVLSMAGLAYAMRELPVGTSYAVWVGIGASLTVAYGMFTGAEPVSVVKMLLVVGIIGCVVGLKYIH
jgi:quaternary ammonium compound-resistance protein SugE